MKSLKKILEIFRTKKTVECKHSEVCPIYLSYLNEYGKDSIQVKYCKQPSIQYCKKYNLINKDEWKNLDSEQKLKVIEEMELLKVIKKDDFN